MNSRVPETEGEIPVVCGVCRTRSYAAPDQIGQDLVCPDCHTLNRVEAPPRPPTTAPKYTGDEYRLADDQPATARPPEELVKVVCGTCYTLMHARLEHVGKRVKCPDCGTITVVPRPPARKPAFRAPDADDVIVEHAPPPRVDEKRKEMADRLMASAAETVAEQERERPRPPRDPLRNGIYQFPFYTNIIPLWVGTAVALLVDFALFEVLVDIIQSGGRASIMAAFVIPIVTIFTFSIVGMVIPHFLTIIEFTAEGFDKVPYFPSQDLLSRGRGMLFGVNALAMSTMPGMLLVTPLRNLGVPTTLGLISTVLLLPLVVLSMAENDSVFAPYSKFVFGSLRRHYDSWSRFYLQVILLAIGFVALDYLVWTVIGQVNTSAPGMMAKLTGSSVTREYISRCVTAFSLTLYAVIYCRLVGRMAWVLGQEEVESPEADDDDESELAGERFN